MTKRCFRAVIEPLCFLWQIIGLMPMSFRNRCKQCKRLSSGLCRRAKSASNPWLVLVILTTCLDIYGMMPFYRCWPTVVAFIDLTMRLLHYFKVVWVLAGCTLYTLKEFRLFLKTLEYVDRCLGLRGNKRITILGVFLNCSFAVVLVSNYVLLFGFTCQCAVSLRITLWLLYVIFGLVDTLITFYVVGLVVEVWTRFRDLNCCVSAAVARYAEPSLSQLLLDEAPLAHRQVELRHIRLAHAALHRGAELLQRHIGATMALTVANSFSGAIFTSYGVLALWTAPDRHGTTGVYRSMWSSLVAFFYHMVRLAAMAVACSAAASQAERTRVLVSRAATAGVPRARRAELAAVQLQVADMPSFSFTAAGFMTVDRRLLVTVLSATITYLVIVGQISMA